MKKRLAALVAKLGISRQILVGLLTIVLVLIAAAARMFENVELSAYDAWYGLRGPVPAPSEIVIVGIDDKSITQIGRWPWNRSVHGELLDVLKEAKVVAFDLILSEENLLVPGDDDLLAAAIKRHPGAVLSTFTSIEVLKPGQPPVVRYKYPTKVLHDALKEGKHRFSGQGLVNTPTDDDGVVRANIPVDLDGTGMPYPSLSLAAVMKYKGYTPDQIQVEGSGGPVTVGDITINRNREGKVLLNYYGPAGSIPTYSYASVLKDPKFDRSVFKDKIVFVGAIDPTLKDDFPAPFAKDTQAGQLLPGVEIQATTAATYLYGNSFTRWSHSITNWVTLLLGLLVLILSSRLRAVWGAAAALGIAVVYVGVVAIAWFQFRFWMDVVTPVVASLLVYTVATVENYLREEAEKARVRNMFGRYVSHNVVNELLQNPEMQEMGGKRFAVTILFSDIRGFTSFSETRDPQEVVQRINDYCKEMVDLIYKNGGTLDKYMGDGIMAYFGAPVPQSDHAARALKCAHEMREKMKELHARWKAAGMLTFKIGVGMNSGEVIAGNIGHPDRVEYSLIGSAVNLAARLESMTKEYAKSEYGGIIFSSNTAEQVPPELLKELGAENAGDVEIRGMVQKVQIYTM